MGQQRHDVVFADFMDISDEEFRRVTEVTYHGYVYGTRAALDRMLPPDAIYGATTEADV